MYYVFDIRIVIANGPYLIHPQLHLISNNN